MRNKKAFTLIELVAVLVILAILALIVTPIVMSIINKAKTSANKRSIDAYGRSIELAIASHMLDTGEIPTSIDELTIEYNGDEVVCETQELKSDSTVYLAGCTVGGKAVEGYTYGKSSSSDSENTSYEAYQIGDRVSYNNVTYYVIEDSDITNDTVKLLKENPLTKTEIDALNLTGVDYGESYPHIGIYYGESSDYSQSQVKRVVDAWKDTAVKLGDSATARLITKEEIDNNFEFEEFDIDCGGCGAKGNRIKSNWMYNSNYSYWTSSISNDYIGSIYAVGNNGSVTLFQPTSYQEIRPLIELNKSADITKID